MLTVNKLFLKRVAYLANLTWTNSEADGSMPLDWKKTAQLFILSEGLTKKDIPWLKQTILDASSLTDIQSFISSDLKPLPGRKYCNLEMRNWTIVQATKDGPTKCMVEQCYFYTCDNLSTTSNRTETERKWLELP